MSGKSRKAREPAPKRELGSRDEKRKHARQPLGNQAAQEALLQQGEGGVIHNNPMSMAFADRQPTVGLDGKGSDVNVTGTRSANETTTNLKP